MHTHLSEWTAIYFKIFKHCNRLSDTHNNNVVLSDAHNVSNNVGLPDTHSASNNIGLSDMNNVFNYVGLSDKMYLIMSVYLDTSRIIQDIFL